MKITELNIKRRTSGLEDLYNSSRASKKFVTYFMNEQAPILRENHFKQNVILTEHYFNNFAKELLFEKDDRVKSSDMASPEKVKAATVGSSLDIDAKPEADDPKAKANKLLNALADASKSGDGYDLDKIVQILRKNYDENKIKAALKNAGLDIKNTSFQGAGGNQENATESLNLLIKQLKDAQASKDDELVKQIAGEMTQFATDRNDPKISKAVQAVLKKFKVNSKQSTKDIKKTAKNKDLNAQQAANQKAGQQADPKAQADLKAKLQAKRGKAVETLLRGFEKILLETQRRDRIQYLKENVLNEYEINSDQLTKLVRNISDLDSGVDSGPTAKSAETRATLQNLPNDVKKDIKQNNQDMRKTVGNLGNTKEMAQYGDALANDPEAAEKALQGADKMRQEILQKSPEAEGAVNKIFKLIKDNKGKTVMAAGIAGLLGIAAITGGAAMAGTVATAMAGAGATAGAFSSLGSFAKGAVKKFKQENGSIFQKIKKAAGAGVDQAVADRSKALGVAMFAANMVGGVGLIAQALKSASDGFQDAFSDTDSGQGGELGGNPDAPSAGELGNQHANELSGTTQGTGDGQHHGNEFQDTPAAGRAADPNFTPTPDVSSYDVASGDDIGSIAQGEGVSVDSLMKANPDIKNFNDIQPGQQLNIPSEKIPDGQNIWKGTPQSTMDTLDNQYHDGGASMGKHTPHGSEKLNIDNTPAQGNTAGKWDQSQSTYKQDTYDGNIDNMNAADPNADMDTDIYSTQQGQQPPPAQQNDPDALSGYKPMDLSPEQMKQGSDAILNQSNQLNNPAEMAEWLSTQDIEPGNAAELLDHALENGLDINSEAGQQLEQGVKEYWKNNLIDQGAKPEDIEGIWVNR